MFNFFSRKWSEDPLDRKKSLLAEDKSDQIYIKNEVPEGSLDLADDNVEISGERFVRLNDDYSSYDLDKLEAISDLKNLQFFVGNQVKNRLKRYANSTVFCGGNENSDLMLIGEAPGADEDLRGEPFIGDSGKLLASMLKDTSLNRDNFYITNLVFWRPPNNRPPSLEEIDFFRPLLQKHIELKKPKAILLLGATALKGVFGAGHLISKVRGTILQYKNIPTVATFHPSYVLRLPSQKALVISDLNFFSNLVKKEIEIEKQYSY